jgi:SAM-dependent methyltransferase
MGLDANGTRFLLYAATQGVSFSRTATLGRQGLHVTVEQLDDNLSRFGYRADAPALLARDGYAEPFLQLLGAREIRSFDASSYEHATDIGDFNRPIDAQHRDQFTAVIDGGTLEHIFNFPIAIENCMRMLAVGGHFLSITPANNFFGHGFYQFSPELFFRIFSEQAGFRLKRVIVFEDTPDAKWFEVVDPDVVKSRVTLVNTRPTYLAILAQKLATTPLFQTPPQQSDYVTMWQAVPKASTHVPGARARKRRGALRRGIRALQERLGDSIEHALFRRLRLHSIRNRRYYAELRVP